LRGELPDSVKQSFILTTQGTFSPHAERAKEAGFAYREFFSAGHDAMITQPAALVEILLELTLG